MNFESKRTFSHPRIAYTRKKKQKTMNPNFSAENPVYFFQARKKTTVSFGIKVPAMCKPHPQL